MKYSFFKCKVLCLWAVLMATLMPAQANDGTYYTSGNQLVPLTETDISVRKEVLTISLMDNGYARVDVYYEFWNPKSENKYVLMGFEADPSYNDDYKFHPNGIHPNIKDFTVEMNGMVVSYNSAACFAGTGKLDKIDTRKSYVVYDNNQLYEEGHSPDQDGKGIGIDFAYVYYFDAVFKPGLNRVHHTYTYKMSDVVGLSYLVSYKLSPATRWANGQIDDFTLIVRADNTAKHFLIRQDDLQQSTYRVIEGKGKTRRTQYYDFPANEFSLRNGAVSVHVKNFKPTDELIIQSYDIFQHPDDVLQSIGITYDRTNSMNLTITLYNNPEPNPADTAFIRRVARNLPYANRGHVFRDAKLRKYFESLWWYMPDPKYKDDESDFTDADWDYIKYGKGIIK